MPKNAEFYHNKGFKYIAGVDEVGRGPLAGPVCAAAVILPYDLLIEGVNDSKKLSEKKREALFDVIKENAIACSTAFVEPAIIDKINIRNATHQAMQAAIDALEIKPDIILVDGNDKIPFGDFVCEYIVKGDAEFECIAAASIIAKVTRDSYMKKQDLIYPGYGFAKNKGYGTYEHMLKIRESGLTEIHRKTYITDKVLGKV